MNFPYQSSNYLLLFLLLRLYLVPQVLVANHTVVVVGGGVFFVTFHLFRISNKCLIQTICKFL